MKKQIKKRRDLRILWNTNALNSYSGYGVEAKDILFRLIKDGWPIAVSAFWGLQGGPSHFIYPEDENPKLQGLKILQYPMLTDPHGSDGIYYHALDYHADVVFSMQDIWTLNPEFLSKMRYWIPYFPVDKEPLPTNVLDKLRYAYKSITFSQFGHDLLEKSGFVSDLILEGTDTEIFKPMDKEKARQELGIKSGLFLFAMVAANKENPPRKGFQEALTAFKMFHDKHPDSGIIFSIQQQGPTGFPIREYAHYLGIDSQLAFIADYTAMFKPSSPMINKLFNAADVLLHPSQTEGFGLTIIEAAAAGTPAIVARGQSMPELVIEGKTGFIADVLYKRFTADLSFVNVVDPKSIYEQMEKSFDLVTKNENKVTTDCRNWIKSKFDIDKIVEEKWIPYYESLQSEILPLKGKDSSIKFS